jgi:Uma2 family endonuclease
VRIVEPHGRAQYAAGRSTAVTATLTDRIDVAHVNGLSLDDLFEVLEQMHVPEGFKSEIVDGIIYVSPQRSNHWDITFDVINQLQAKFGMKQLKSDVRIDFPGYLNGFAADVVALRAGSAKDAKGRFGYQDVEFVAEVISRGTAKNDYGPKKAAYAMAEVPVYVIIDPYSGQCHVHTLPKGDEYRGEVTVDFGDPVDLTGTGIGLVLTTDRFDRE